MAVGITTFALVSIMALFPVGMVTLRQSMTQTLEAQVVRQLSGEIALTPYSKLSALAASGAWWFDADGRQVSTRDDALLEVTLIPAAASYPGSSAMSASSIQNVQVRIENLRTEAGSAVKSYNVLIANAGE